MTITLHTPSQHRLSLTLTFISALILLLFPFLVKAGNYTTIANGKWSNSAIWSGGVVPGATDTATIAYTDTLDASESIKNITINSSKSLTVSGTNTLTVYGNFTNNGTFTAASGTVSFTGSANQIISGTGAITFYNLTGNPSAVADTIFLGKAITINNNFTISQGAFDCKTYQITGNTSGTMSMASGTVLLLGLPSSTTNVLFPSSYTNANISLNTNSTVIYQADNTSTGQTVSVAPYYGNLVLSNGASGTTYGTVLYVTGNMTIGSGVSFKTNANIDTLKGTLTINSGGTYTLEGTTLYFQGNLVNNGTFNGTVGTCNFDGSTNQVISGPINNPTNTFFNALNFTPKYSTDTTFIEANISTTTGISNHGVMIVPAAYNDSIIYDAGITNVGTCIAYNGVSYFKTGYLTSAVAGNPSIFHKITVNQNFCFYCNTIVTSDFTRIGGTLSYYGTDTLFLAGNYINNTTASTSMDAICMNGSHNQTIGGTVSPYLGILIINQAASTDTVKLGDSLTCYGIILTKGVLDVTPANYSITNGRGVTNNSTFLTRSGTLYFINAYTPSIGGSSINIFNNVVCNGSGTLDLANNLTVKGNFIINSGAFDVTTSNYHLTVGGNFTNNGTFTQRSGTVTLNGSTNQTLSGTGALTFYNLIGKQASATDSIFLGKAITVNNNLADSAGVFDCQNYQVTGNTSGTLTLAANTGLVLGLPSSTTNIAFPTSFTTAHTTLNTASTVRYQANIAQTISTTPTYGNLVLASGTTATRKTPASSTLAVAGNLNVNANTTLVENTGTLNLTGNLTNADTVLFTTGALNIGGTFTNNGSFTYGTGTVTFNGSTNTQVNGSNAPTFYNFILNKTAGTDTLFLNNPITVNNTLTTTLGILDCQRNQLTNSSTPAVSLSPSSVTICNGSSTTLTASGYSTYVWAPNTGLSASTGASVTANPSASNTYTVIGNTSNKYTCALNTSGSGAVTVNPTPTVTITPSSATICSGSSDTLRASGASTYTWSPGTGLSVTTGATVVASPTVTTTYTITGSNSYGCTSSTSQIITVSNCLGNSCSSAISITPTSGFSPTDYSFSPGQNNEWFSFTADSANMIINFTRPVMAADTPIAIVNSLILYSGSCGSLSTVSSDTVPGIIGLMPSINISGLTSGSTYTIQIANTNISGCSNCFTKTRYFGVSIRGVHNGATALGTANVPIISWQLSNAIPQSNPGPDWFYDIIPATSTADAGNYFAVGYSANTVGVIQASIAKINGTTGAMIWGKTYDGGKANDQGYFFKVIQTTDATNELVAVGVKQPQYWNTSGASTNYNDNVFAGEFDPSTGLPVTSGIGGGPFYYGYDNTTTIMSRSTSTTSPVTGDVWSEMGQFNGLEALYNSGGTLTGFIMSGTNYTTATSPVNHYKPFNDHAFMIKLNPDLSLNTGFGNNGYRQYQYTDIRNNKYITIASDIAIMNEGTSLEQYALTGWSLGAGFGSTTAIYLLVTDVNGNIIANNIYDYKFLNNNGYTKLNRYETTSIGSWPANDEWGFNLLWVQSTGTLLLNAGCDFEQPGGYGGTFYFSTIPNTDEYESFTDAILSFDDNGDFEQLKNITAFDGFDFWPALVQTPDGAFALAGNITYSSPDFPGSAYQTSLNTPPYNASPWINTVVPTTLGVNIDILKLDASLNTTWNQQYKGWHGSNYPSAPGAVFNCLWGFNVTPDGGFIASGDNELNGDDNFAIKLLYPASGITTAVSQVNESTISPLFNTVITTNTTWNTDHYIEGVVDVAPGVTLTINSGAKIYFADKMETGIDSKIVLEQGGGVTSPSTTSGAILNISGTGTTVTAIPGNSNGGTMWQGIEAGGVTADVPTDVHQSRVFISGGATVSYALNGVSDIRYDAEGQAVYPNTGSARISCSGANFTDNWNGVQVYANMKNAYNNIISSDFTTDNVIGHSLYPGNFITVNGNSATIANNHFNNSYWSSETYAGNLGNGVYSIDGRIIVDGSNDFNNLNYGFCYLGINSSSPLTCSNNTFEDNATSIMIKSSTNPSINSNTFTRSRTIQRQGIPIPIAGTTSTDLALYSSTGYSVVDNVFIGYSSQSGYGTIIDYSNFPGNTAGNEINRNQYDTYSHVGTFHLGSSYYHVGGAAIQAQENNSGLQIHCNQNGQSIGTGHNPNYNDIVAAASTTNTIPPTTIPPIASIQGNCSTPTSTAGNTFSTCSSPTNDNLYSNLFSYKYNYNPNSSFVPTCYSSIITPSNCGPPSDPYSTVCPDPLASSCGNGSYVTCRAVHAALKKTHDSSQAVIDSGNASKLFHILSIGTPAQIQDSLLAAGPYLSDSLLLATIANSLPFDTLKNILEPNAPLTSRVVEAAYALIGLPGNIRDSLEAAQLGGPSARRQLNESIIYYSNETDIAANSILREYMADTTINGIDSSLAFLKTISGVPSLAQQANLNMLKSSFDSAKNLVDSINTLGQMKDFCSLSTVLIQLADSGKNIFQMTTIQYDTVSGIAHRPVISQSTLNARAILAEVYNISIPDTILPILDSVSGHRAIKPNTSKNSMDSIAEGSIKLYPNPANNKLNIAYNLDNNLVSNLVIYDLMGNKITEYILPQNVSMVSENISNLPAGFYVYCVETGNKIVQRGKFVVVR